MSPLAKIVEEYKTDLRLITRNVWLFLLGGLFIGVLAAFMQLLLNLYFKEIGFGESFIGRVLSFSAFGGLLAAIPAAFLAARFRMRPILLISSVILSISFFSLSTSQWQWLTLFSAFCVGLMMAVKNVVSGPFIMRNSTERERTFIFSLNFSTWIVAGIVGSLSGGWLHDLFLELTDDGVKAYQLALVVAAIIGLLGVIPFSFVKSERPHADEAARVFSWQSLKNKRTLFFKLTIPFFLVGAGAGLIIPFLNLYFKNRFHLDTAKIGVYFSVLQFAMLAAVLIAPVMKRRLGFIKTVVLTELLSIPFMLILCYTNDLSMAFWAFIFRGALMNMGVPVTNAFMLESVSREDQGLINSISSIAWGGSWAFSTQIGGIMIEKSGFVPVFLVAIGLYVVSAILYYYFFSICERREGDRIIIEPARIR